MEFYDYIQNTLKIFKHYKHVINLSLGETLQNVTQNDTKYYFSEFIAQIYVYVSAHTYQEDCKKIFQ